jgi:hypothetical protein
MSVFPKKTIQISLILLAFLSIANIVSAQQIVASSMSSIELNYSPSSPRTGDSVQLTVTSSSIDLSSATIVWYVDGVIKKGANGNTITLKTKTDGGNSTVKVVIETPDNIIKEATKVISTAAVDLIAEPMSYVPPFYKGKPYFTNQGLVKIVAVPDVMVNGKKASSQDLNFIWTSNDLRLDDSSGKDKDSIVVQGTMPIRDVDMSVQVYDNAGNLLAKNSKLVLLRDPQILFYEDSPLYGILYNKAIFGSYDLGNKEEVTIDAEPLSFVFLKNTSSDANYSWSVNGNSVTPNLKINEILLKQTTNAAGTASISLNLKNNSKILQYASGGFNISFGQ